MNIFIYSINLFLSIIFIYSFIFNSFFRHPNVIYPIHPIFIHPNVFNNAINFIFIKSKSHLFI